MSFWKKCSTCKRPIKFDARYFVCSVSTCTGKRTGFVFCSVECFDGHIPVMSHRSAGAIEKKAPTEREFQNPELIPKRQASADEEILVVVSKVKKYIKDRHGMNTSDSVMLVLSHKLRTLAHLSIEEAKRNGRKTVFDRDIC